MAMAGTASLVKVSPTAGGAGVYTTVADINSASMSHAGNTLDVGAFGITYMQRILGLKDATYSLSGFWLPTDTNGQVAIRNAWLNNTTLWIQFLPDGVAGFKQEVKVTSIDISTSVDGVVDVQFQLDGTGAIAAV